MEQATARRAWLIDLDLIFSNPDFRRLVVARTISIFTLGMLTVAVPMQVFVLTRSSIQIGIIASCDGVGMFAGLLLGGTLADLRDRRRLILSARTLCGLGFAGLAVNAALPNPAVAALYVLATWDGFFGAIGVSALMASMPQIVGRERLIEAGAIGMLSARFAMIAAPAVGGMLIAWLGVGISYAIAALGTLVTVLTLRALPRLDPPQPEEHHPLQMITAACGFVQRQPLLMALFAVGIVMALVSSMRILFPVLALDVFRGSAVAAGIMYSAVPCGVVLGAILSGWVRTLERPGMAILAAALCACIIAAAVGRMSGVVGAFVLLVAYGYASSVVSLLQVALIQKFTPDVYLGRVMSLATAQDVVGDTLGAVGIGALALVMSGSNALLVMGAISGAVILAIGTVTRSLRALNR